MTHPHLANNLGAWLESIELDLVRSLEFGHRYRHYNLWRDRRGRRSGPGKMARIEGRMTMVRLIADIRAVRRWREELSR